MLEVMLELKLKTYDYYLDKLSMFMRGCYGIPEQYAMLIDILNELDDACNKVINLVDITKDEVFCELVYNTDSRTVGSFNDLLTKLGNLYGVSQHFTLSFVEDGVREEHEVDLTPFEFWLLIKAQILQNCFDGSYIQTREFYDKMNLPVYIFTNVDNAEALMILNTTSDIVVRVNETSTRQYAITNNIIYLFKAGYFTIKSMGITYSHSISDTAYLAIWDSTDENKMWDVAKWGS